MRGYDLGDDFLDDVVEGNQSVLFGVSDPLLFWDESEEGGVKG
jgi:hypothetical protein